MVIIVPMPTYCPMPAMTTCDTRSPMTSPAMTIIVPEVMTVGNDKFRVSIIASRLGIFPRSSL